MSSYCHNIGFSPSSLLCPKMSPNLFPAEGSCCKSINCFFDFGKSPKSLLSIWYELSYKILPVLFPFLFSLGGIVWEKSIFFSFSGIQILKVSYMSYLGTICESLTNKIQTFQTIKNFRWFRVFILSQIKKTERMENLENLISVAT